MFTVTYHPADGLVGRVVNPRDSFLPGFAEIAMQQYARGAAAAVNGGTLDAESEDGNMAVILTDATGVNMYGMFKVTEIST